MNNTPSSSPPRIIVRGGDAPAQAPLVSLPAAALRDRGAVPAGATSLLLTDEQSGATVPAQLSADGSSVAWIVPGTVASGAERRFVIAPSAAPGQPEDGGQRPGVVQKMDRLVFTVDGQERARYTFLGARRPYWWPLIGPTGRSVVRGQGSEDHPHHTGLTLAYGGHGEGGSTNIWSDWDETPYGPGGRMVHRGFQYVGSGPVYAEAVQDLAYLNVSGDVFCHETRRQRVWPGPDGTLFLDIEAVVSAPRDPGTHPFLLAARLPGSMDVRGKGQVVSSEGPRRADENPAGRWVDGSGPVSDGWNGIALLDHPGNHDFPGTLYKYAVMEQLTLCHYPPAEAGADASMRWRVYVHGGNAREALVEEHWAAYAGKATAHLADGAS